MRAALVAVNRSRAASCAVKIIRLIVASSNGRHNIAIAPKSGASATKGASTFSAITIYVTEPCTLPSISSAFRQDPSKNADSVTRTVALVAHSRKSAPSIVSARNRRIREDRNMVARNSNSATKHVRQTHRISTSAGPPGHIQHIRTPVGRTYSKQGVRAAGKAVGANQARKLSP